jgi:hypothetical protein
VAIAELCCSFGRADLIHTLVGRGLSVAAAKAAIISDGWDRGFVKARGQA